MNKSIHIFGGGTINHVRNHLALCAPAYGGTANILYQLCRLRFNTMDSYIHLTKMAGGRGHGKEMETNDDVAQAVQNVVDRETTRIVFMTCAICDFNGEIGSEHPGKYAKRLPSSIITSMKISPADKIVSTIRKQRKDIFLVACKTTCGASEDEQYIAGLDLCKRASCNLVLANDTKTRLNMIVTPEEARYCVTKDRKKVLWELTDMTWYRTHLNFTRSTVVDGQPVKMTDVDVPLSMKVILDWLIEQNAYKPFNGATAGHFAIKVGPNEFLTSIRKTNFNDLWKNGLVRIKTDGPDNVIAYGAKPSVGGQSQRIVFSEHPEYDCIVHFHCPIKPGSKVPIVSQREFECGSHECGRNTSRGLERFGNLSAVYLDQHGPNIVFNSSIQPMEVINFIQDNFDLSKKTGGYVTIQSRLNTSNTLETAKEVLC